MSKNDTRGDSINVGKRGDSGTESNLLDKKICIKGREHRKGDSGGRRTRAKGNGGVCWGLVAAACGRRQASNKRS